MARRCRLTGELNRRWFLLERSARRPRERASGMGNTRRGEKGGQSRGNISGDRWLRVHRLAPLLGTAVGRARSAGAGRPINRHAGQSGAGGRSRAGRRRRCRSQFGEAMEGAAGCFHLAAISLGGRVHGANGWATHRANLSGTVAVFEAAARLGRIRWSTLSSPRSTATAPPFRSRRMRRPDRSPRYGADEVWVASSTPAWPAVVHEIPDAWACASSNVFGPRQDPLSPYSGVISIFCDRLSRGEPVTIFGDGGQTSAISSSSPTCVEALLRAMGKASVRAPAPNVLHRGCSTSVRDLVLARSPASFCQRPSEICPVLGASRAEICYSQALAGAHPRGAGLSAAAAAGKRPWTGAGIGCGPAGPGTG